MSFQNDPKLVDLAVRLVNQELHRSEGDVMFSLGIGYIYQNAPPGKYYSAPYQKLGEELWQAFRYELFDVICDASNSKPVIWVEELVSGDIRNLIVGVLSAVTAKYDVHLGIAVPVTALIIKHGVSTFCKTKPKKLSEKSVGDILSRRK